MKFDSITANSFDKTSTISTELNHWTVNIKRHNTCHYAYSIIAQVGMRKITQVKLDSSHFGHFKTLRTNILQKIKNEKLTGKEVSVLASLIGFKNGMMSDFICSTHAFLHNKLVKASAPEQSQFKQNLTVQLQSAINKVLSA